MVEPSKIPAAFAVSGDKNVIPENSTTTGAASWSAGFPAITSVPVSQGGVAPARADFNGILNALSLGLMWLQQGNHYSYSAELDYNPGALVSEDGALYFCKQANGPTTEVVAPGTDSTVWGLLLNAEGNSTINTSGHAGNASVATKALQDGAGNVITATYLTQSDAATTYATKEEDAAKLPLTGGDINGYVNAKLSNLDQYREYGFKDPTGAQMANVRYYGADHTARANGLQIGTRYTGSSAWYSGPQIMLRPAGNMELQAQDANGVVKLNLQPSGSATWDGKTIECAVEKGAGYLKLTDGTQVCFGPVAINNTAGVDVTFPRAFADGNVRVVANPVGGSGNRLNTNIGTRSATKFHVWGVDTSGAAVTYISAHYIAIGTGA